MGLCGKIQHGARLVLGQQARYQILVTDVSLYEQMACVRIETGQILAVARISQLIEADDFFIMACQPVQNEVGANEAGTAGNKESHGVRSFGEWPPRPGRAFLKVIGDVHRIA